jgi:hypothetical protein
LLYILQELEQEKYHLRRRLEVAEEEYDLKVAELQSDINNLRQMLEVGLANNSSVCTVRVTSLQGNAPLKPNLT